MLIDVDALAFRRKLRLWHCVMASAAFGSVGLCLAAAPAMPVRSWQSSVALAQVSPAVPQPISINTENRAEVVAAFQNLYMASENIPMEWSGDVDQCQAGANSEAYRRATILRVNYYRAMAGLPGDVILDEALNDASQAAALMMAAQGDASHFPEPNWRCYSALGAAAAQRSNLYFGRSGPSAIDAYMDDHQPQNYFVGHRRWILYPPQRVMGCGSIPGGAGNQPANALWVTGTFGNRPNQPEWVAWPPKGFVPYQIMPRLSERWSFSYSGADFSKATVQMRLNEVSLSVELEALLNDQGRGDNTIVWRPKGIPNSAPESDLTCTVAIGNVVVNRSIRNFEYQVTIIDANALFLVKTSALPEGFVGAPYSVQLAASGGQEPFLWLLASESAPLPLGFVLEPDGHLKGTAQASGSYKLTFKVVDAGNQTAIRSFDLLISSGAGLLLITTEKLPEVRVEPGSFYSARLDAAGGRTPYTWSVFSGTLPEGVSLLENGRLTAGFTPPAGVFSFVAEVTDAGGLKSTKSFTLVVPGEVPVVLTESLPRGEAGQFYAVVLEAFGGLPPYTWELAPESSPLPDGLQLSSDGSLRGVPQRGGAYSFQVQVRDAAQAVATRTLSATFKAAPARLRIGPQTSAAIKQQGCRMLLTSSYPGSYAIEFSQDLILWKALLVVEHGGVEREFLDSTAAGSTQRFYRTRGL